MESPDIDNCHNYANTTLSGLAVLTAFENKDAATMKALLGPMCIDEVLASLLNALSLTNQAYANEKGLDAHDTIALLRKTIIGEMAEGTLSPR